LNLPYLTRHIEQHFEASGSKVSAAMKRYAIVIEKADSNYSAYVPDLPGCVATGSTVEETEELLREAINLHINGLREDGLEIPDPSSVVEYLELETIH
jgi:predicted RNase H-like HicB family nuclease